MNAVAGFDFAFACLQAPAQAVKFLNFGIKF